jgi:hypothetical protein
MKKPRKGEAAFDSWSWAHLSSGLGLGASGVAALPAAAVLVGFEVFEAGLRRLKVDGTGLFEYESWKNIFTDIAVGLVGYAAVRAGLKAIGPRGEQVRQILPTLWRLAATAAQAVGRPRPIIVAAP